MDAATIESWWTRWPDANVGIVTGAAGMVAIDIDPRNGGDESLAELEAEYGALPATVEALTGGGGRHLFFAHPGGKLAGKLRPGIDVKADGGYVVVAPSVHVTGERYRWRGGRGPHELKPASLPSWLRVLLCADWLPSAAPPAAGNRPGDDFNRRGNVRELLRAYGWQRSRTGDNEHWTRPGKPAGTSATFKSGIFYVFSTNAQPFEANRAYSPFAIFALLECGGDYERAARELGRRGYGESQTTGNRTKAGRADASQRVAAECATTLRSIPPFAPFPVDTLPETLSRFTRETAAALGCEPTYVALPALCATAAAIGTTRTIELKSSWREYAIVWAGVVARSGTLKSPAFDTAVKALRDAQIDALRAHEAAAVEYERERLEYERALAAWRKSKASGDPPTKPQPPQPQRFIVADVTIEALAPILETNPRGVLVARDELAGWIRGFDAYKARGHGGDAAAWVELWRAGTLIVDRKSGDKRTLYVPRAAVSVCGTIQPGVLADVLTAEHFENGLAARLLLARPPELEKSWSERTPTRTAVEDCVNLIRDLLALEHIEGERGPEPVCLPLSVEARALWAAWYNLHAKRIAQAETEREAAALAKIEAYAARFALVFTLATDPWARSVSADAMQRGITLADWFAGETARVYGLLAESDEDRERRRLVELIERRGGQVTARELRQRFRRFRDDGEAAERALAELADAGYGHWEQPRPDRKGGRPTRVFVLSTLSTVYETSAGPAENGGFVDVDTVDNSADVGGDGCPDGEFPPDSVLVGYPETDGAADDEWGEI